METLHLHVRNDIIHVGDDFVVARSEHPGRDCPISEDRVRNYSTQNGSIIDALRRILAGMGSPKNDWSPVGFMIGNSLPLELMSFDKNRLISIIEIRIHSV
jgi:hypothetical protein